MMMMMMMMMMTMKCKDRCHSSMIVLVSRPCSEHVGGAQFIFGEAKYILDKIVVSKRRERLFLSTYCNLHKVYSY